MAFYYVNKPSNNIQPITRSGSFAMLRTQLNFINICSRPIAITILNLKRMNYF